MKYRLLVLLFVLTGFISSAQKYFLNSGGFDYNMKHDNLIIDSIVDVREEKNCIGFISTGLLDKPTAAYLDHPLTYYIKRYLSKNSEPDKYSEHLILRINKLLIYEVTSGNGQTAVAEMNLSFIVKKGERYFEKFQVGATSERSAGSINVQHQKNILEVLEKSIFQYMERNKFYFSKINEDFPETELQTNPLGNINYRIDGIKHFTRGIYFSFFDFRDYTPDTISNFNVEYVGAKGSPKYSILKTLGGDLINRAWAFSDGNQNYFRIGDVYYPLKKEGKYFSLYDYPRQFVSFVVVPDLIFGLIFTALYNSTAAVTAKKVQYNINLSTGSFFPANSSGDIKVESRIVILSSRYNKLGKDLELFVNGASYCVLGKGSFTVLSFNSSVKNVDICLKMNGEKICISSQPELFNTDLYLVVVKGDKISIDHPNRDKKNELIGKIKDGNFTRVEKQLNETK